jgi:hypothetical protein
MSEDLQELEEQLMLKKKKKNATRRMEQIIRLHTEGNRAKLDQARQRESKSRTHRSSFALFFSRDAWSTLYTERALAYYSH